jgi:hypothetical protein
MDLGIRARKAIVKTPTERMGLSASARAALTALCKGLSREVAADKAAYISGQNLQLDGGAYRGLV